MKMEAINSLTESLANLSLPVCHGREFAWEEGQASLRKFGMVEVTIWWFQSEHLGLSLGSAAVPVGNGPWMDQRRGAEGMFSCSHNPAVVEGTGIMYLWL